MKTFAEFAGIPSLLITIVAFLLANRELLSEYEIALPVAAGVIALGLIWLAVRGSPRLWHWYRGTWKSTRLRALHDELEAEFFVSNNEVAYSLGPATIDMEPWDRAHYEALPFDQPERSTRRSKILYELAEIGLRFPKEHQLQDWVEYLDGLTEHSLRSDYKAARKLTESWRRKIGERPHPYVGHPHYDRPSETP